MSWPALSECVKGFDVWRGNNPDDGRPDRTKGRIDFARLKADNPAVEFIVSRAAGSSSGVDPDYAYNFDESQKAGFKAGAYVNNNAYQTTAFMLELWKRAFDGRDPDLIDHDCESPVNPAKPAGGLAKVTPQAMTKAVRLEHDAIRIGWARAIVEFYTGKWWWDPSIIHGWEGNEALWDAHYIFTVQDAKGNWRQSFKFEECDRLLPISNKFTPQVPTGFTAASIGTWQMSEYGNDIVVHTVDGRRIKKKIDLNYMLRTRFEQVFGIKPLPPVSLPPPVVPSWERTIDRWARQEAFTPYQGPAPA
jgi:hypothetical protein